MLSEVTDLRIVRRAPRASGLCGGWVFHCAFAGRTWSGRIYGRDWDFLGDGDEAAWKELSGVHRDAFRDRIVASFERSNWPTTAGRTVRASWS
jgi:hypothetical protein